ncbi:hypothetical protein [Skermania piniformis]|uniref:hypothetical protein n=1 Tax=Skermania pinensis TaxID=39122 RepID=UPI000832EFFF|nr:hypothetical protein [Skermania piniformis]
MPGRLSVRVVGRALHLANTGAPLDRAGVEALTALRVSGKDSSADDRAVGTVGRFGVGFTAVRTLSDEIEIRSRSGSVQFSADRTRSVLVDRGIAAPVDPAVLRLAWPVEAEPVGGDTEVILRLRPDVDVADLLDRMRAEAVELLLELPALVRIEIAGVGFERTVTELGDGRALVTIGDRSWWQYRAGPARWLLPVREGRPVPAPPDVLRAPTRSDEQLSLPALLIAPAQLQPDRRRLLPGARLDDAVVRAYPAFARTLPPAERLVLVPAPGFPRSELDGVLHDQLLAELRGQPWLPVLTEPGGSRAPAVLAPARATVFPGLTTALAAVLAEVSAALVIPDLSGSAAAAELTRLGVRRLGLADLAESVAGVQRPPAWWARLYAALEPFVVDRAAAAELGALPVPLADGRLVTGPRTTLLLTELGDAGAGTGVSWARVVHPDAADPLLARLGARAATAAELLAEPELLALLDAGAPAPATVTAVLRLAETVTDPADLPAQLGLLPLPDDTGALRAADELLLPGAPLASLLVADAPFGTVAADLVEQVGARALRAVGVGWGFTVLRAADPIGPDPELDDAELWWESLAEDPPELVAVRDLDLVADGAWAAALGLLAAEPATRPLLADPVGYTGWWLRRHVRLAGVPLARLRRPADPSFAGLLDECTHPDAAAFAGLLADPERIDADLAQALVDALGDPGRSPDPATVVDVHRRLAGAVTAGRLDPESVRLPNLVRAVTGAVAEPDVAVVVDRPWLAAAIPADRLVVGEPRTATALAALLDLPVASDRIHGRVASVGRPGAWAAAPAAVLAQVFFGIDGGEVVVIHEKLTVRLTGDVSGEVAVGWWVTDDGVVHLQDWLAGHLD